MLCLSCAISLEAQAPYTQKQFPVRIETDIEYGSATTFAGGTEPLSLDLYKPLGDGNCSRPLLVMIHGGGWISGTQKDGDVAQICQEMAARGYVCASIEYRLGMHVLPYYEPYLFCNDALNPIGVNKCIYFADSLEIFRALYRGMQDAKGAIRFLKNRHELDSTDVHNVFTGGSSAGAFIANYVGTLDLPSEKPAACFALEDAPLADPDLASCIPAPANRTRPDLGDIEGDLNLGNQNAGVQGVASFMGGVFDAGLLMGPDTPAIYIYHRTDDLVVPCGTAPILEIYPVCFIQVNFCQPLYNRPIVHGGCSIADYLESLGNNAPPFLAEIFEYPINCFANPPGHSIDNIPLRCENLSGFFAPLIAANGNVPSANCPTGVDDSFGKNKEVRIFPNPVQDGVLTFACEDCLPGNYTLRLMDVTGRILAETRTAGLPFTWDLNGADWTKGLYFIELSSAGLRQIEKIIVTK